MKPLIIAVLLLLAGTAWAGDFPLDVHGKPYMGDIVESVPKGLVTVNKDALIREWAASGDICRVLGHQWTYTVHIVSVFPEPADSPKGYRDCTICGKKEKKYVTTKEEWR